MCQRSSDRAEASDTLWIHLPQFSSSSSCETFSGRADLQCLSVIRMRFALYLAPLLAAIQGINAQHVHYEIPEVEEYVQSMLGEYHQYAWQNSDSSLSLADLL